MHDEQGLQKGFDGINRCWWCGDIPSYREYHDNEWGKPSKDDRVLFEKICLEGFQAGLSWLTILKKRESFRQLFENFEFEKISRFGEAEISHLMTKTAIVRHRGKIESTINNAKRAIELREEAGSLASYFWSFEPSESSRPQELNRSIMRNMSKTKESTELSKALKKRGWRFVGPITCYSFMQAMGMVNDHVNGCDSHPRIARLRACFSRPILYSGK